MHTFVHPWHYLNDELISREEVVGLLFNVSDAAAAALAIERLLREDNGEEEEDDGG
ncbi:MAG TPA: hypothetical protein VFW85_03210 [Gaiellaceae bacterium]|nr:hypothetical protein [Gaiellaceae bacterium]